MKIKYISAIAAAASILGGSTAMAQGMGQDQHGHGPRTSEQRFMGQSGMMQGGMMHGGMMQGGMMPMHQQMMAMHKGMMQGGGMMGPHFRALLDTNEDGEIKPAEARAALAKLLSENDANGDDTLDIAEFEALHNRMIREIMVDRFQYLDSDGDGFITTAEMLAPAKKIEKMQKRMEMMKRAGNMSQGAQSQNGMMQNRSLEQSD